MTIQKDYQVHMLRIWRNSTSNNHNSNELRVSIENPKTAVRVTFDNFESLANYLQHQTEMQIAI